MFSYKLNGYHKIIEKNWSYDNWSSDMQKKWNNWKCRHFLSNKQFINMCSFSSKVRHITVFPRTHTFRQLRDNLRNFSHYASRHLIGVKVLRVIKGLNRGTHFAPAWNLINSSISCSVYWKIHFWRSFHGLRRRGTPRACPSSVQLGPW